MVLKIYFNDKPVFLCDEVNGSIEEHRHHPDVIFIDEVTTPAIKSLLHEIAKPHFHSGILYSEDIEKLKKVFWKHFTIIQAAGGLVKNEKGEILMIFRRGKWDLPKGKLEKGEDLKACAVREVKEETGLKKVIVQHFLLTTYHTYSDFGKQILKESYWYLMNTSSNQITTPQTEEEIHEITWVSQDAIGEKLRNTFPSIKDVIKANEQL
ncbi:MAG: NUDIX domain-containing protein [Chitinophagaceae bacterium]|nr:NUDIX domain-containing protein [Chitinophagaceae bacterium]